MKQGDIIVMRGVTHPGRIRAPRDQPSRLFILIDAAPFMAAGEKRGVLFPA